jgi:hypothetical protein
MTSRKNLPENHTAMRSMAARKAVLTRSRRKEQHIRQIALREQQAYRDIKEALDRIRAREGEIAELRRTLRSPTPSPVA